MILIDTDCMIIHIFYKNILVPARNILRYAFRILQAVTLTSKNVTPHFRFVISVLST